jgi:16S rRNA C967 or C1407 C5-methylase (RsmB/RsmF family)
MSTIELSKNILKVAAALFDEEQERDEFLCALQSGDHGISAVAWLSKKSSEELFPVHATRPPWLPEWIDVAARDARPGKLAEHEAGMFYILDLSSTFALAPLEVIAGSVHCIIDVCAAPGGKGIVGRRYCSPKAVIANEVIGKRTAPLISNYKRCGIDPAIVTSVDPALLGRLLEQRGDLVIVDAPCSGQSLVLKDLAAPGAFHPATIAMNERRQRRILAHSSKAVLPGGYLLYSTCTFSVEENEKNVEWFLRQFPDFMAVQVPILEAFRSKKSELPLYRLYPQLGYGAGAFCCLLRRTGESPHAIFDYTGLPTLIRPVWSSPSMPPAVVASPRTNGPNPRNRRGDERRKNKASSRRARWGYD